MASNPLSAFCYIIGAVTMLASMWAEGLASHLMSINAVLWFILGELMGRKS